MNRQYKRMMKKAEAQKARAPRPSPAAAAKKAGAAPGRERTKPRQFVKEVIAELQKVAWPTRQEVLAYSLVVLVSIIVVGAMIFGMDFVFTKAVLALFDVEV